MAFETKYYLIWFYECRCLLYVVSFFELLPSRFIVLQ